MSDRQTKGANTTTTNHTDSAATVCGLVEATFSTTISTHSMTLENTI